MTNNAFDPAFDDVRYVIGTTGGCEKVVYAVRLELTTVGTVRLFEVKDMAVLYVNVLLYATK